MSDIDFKKKSFEEAMAECDDILKQIESGNLKLEDAIDKFKEGITLINYCKEKLNSYEAEIENFIVTERGIINEDQQ